MDSESKAGTAGTGTATVTDGSSPIKPSKSGGKPAPLPRFVPGGAGGPGRPPKAVEKAYLDAVKAALPPDEIAAVIREALDLARDTRSWRGIVEVLELTLAYGAGRPVQKTASTDGNLDALLAALAGDGGIGGAGGGGAMTAEDVRKLAASNGSGGGHANGKGGDVRQDAEGGNGDR